MEWDLKEYRKKYTLPEPLVEHISHIEWHYPFDDYKYDVFAPILSKGNSNFGSYGELLPIIQMLGTASPETRKYLLACGSYGKRIEGIDLITNLSDLIIAYRKGPILDNDIYFGAEGIGKTFDTATKNEGQENNPLDKDEIVNSFLQ